MVYLPKPKRNLFKEWVEKQTKKEGVANDESVIEAKKNIYIYPELSWENVGVCQEMLIRTTRAPSLIASKIKQLGLENLIKEYQICKKFYYLTTPVYNEDSTLKSSLELKLDDILNKHIILINGIITCRAVLDLESNNGSNYSRSRCLGFSAFSVITEALYDLDEEMLRLEEIANDPYGMKAPLNIMTSTTIYDSDLVEQADHGIFDTPNHMYFTEYEYANLNPNVEKGYWGVEHKRLVDLIDKKTNICIYRQYIATSKVDTSELEDSEHYEDILNARVDFNLDDMLRTIQFLALISDIESLEIIYDKSKDEWNFGKYIKRSFTYNKESMVEDLDEFKNAVIDNLKTLVADDHPFSAQYFIVKITPHSTILILKDKITKIKIYAASNNLEGKIDVIETHLTSSVNVIEHDDLNEEFIDDVKNEELFI